MEILLQIATIPIIGIIVYAVLAGYKIVVDGKDKFTKFMPIIAGALGAVLGVAAFFVAPEMMLSDNIFIAIVKGGASGLAATGINQLVKQFTQKKEEGKEGEKVEKSEKGE